jgi:hypothetical protein
VCVSVCVVEGVIARHGQEVESGLPVIRASQQGPNGVGHVEQAGDHSRLAGTFFSISWSSVPLRVAPCWVHAKREPLGGVVDSQSSSALFWQASFAALHLYRFASCTRPTQRHRRVDVGLSFIAHFSRLHITPACSRHPQRIAARQARRACELAAPPRLPGQSPAHNPTWSATALLWTTATVLYSALDYCIACQASNCVSMYSTMLAFEPERRNSKLETGTRDNVPIPSACHGLDPNQDPNPNPDSHTARIEAKAILVYEDDITRTKSP